MVASHYLIDTSAVYRLVRADAAALDWDDAITDGLIGICDATEIEVLFGARSGAERRQVLDRLRRLYSWVPTPDKVWQRAREIQALLADAGQNRCACAIDLVVAATAEFNNLTVLHYDADFEVMARVVGLRQVWVAPRGSLD